LATRRGPIKPFTPEEWIPVQSPQSALFDALQPLAIEAQPLSFASKSEEELTAEINAAFASGDLATVVEALGSIAKARGMSHVAKNAGLAPESLYRSLNSGGNPEFSTVLKVISSVGLRLSVSKAVGR
jgi:probable addiction module antidote protein